MNETPSGLPPFLSDKDLEKYTSTIEDLSRNSMIRTEVIMKRRKGLTVEQACREVSQKVHKSESHIRDIYYGKTS